MLADSLYLENINEYVQDDDRIVTYKWLSRRLDVPVNAAKQMLYSYVTHCRNGKFDGKAPVTVMYIVSGLVGNKEHQVHLIPENELEVTKQQLGQILGVHVYSVQKNEVKEMDVLYTANQDENKKHLHEYSKWSPIECPSPPKVIKVSRSMSASEKCATDKKRTETVKQEESTLAHTNVECTTESSSLKRNESTEAETKPKNTTLLPHKKPSSRKRPTEKPGTISSMFAKQDHSGTCKSVDRKVKQDSPTSQNKESVASLKQELQVDTGKTTLTSPVKETKTTLVHLVSPKKSPTKLPRKQARSSSKSTKLSIPESNSKSFKGLGDSDIEDDESEKEGHSSSTKVAHSTTDTKKNDTNHGKCTRKKALPEKGAVKVKKPSETKKKKRKRVQDLSSDEEEYIEETKAPVLKKPSVEGEHTQSGGRKRRRVKKMVRKMYENEDGEMITERVHESVSTDASDEEVKQRVEDGGNFLTDTVVEDQIPKESFKAGKKQSTLMNFFKK